jgi:hypothetical protein
MSGSDQFEYYKVLELSRKEIRKVEFALGMDSGYVLNFTDRTFDDFLIDHFDLDLNDDKYHLYGRSKAKRLRAGFYHLGKPFFFKFLAKVKDNWIDLKVDNYGAEKEDVPEIILSLIDKGNGLNPIESSDAINPNKYVNDQDFMSVAKEVRNCIDNNKPVEGLDRLHTFMSWYLKNKCTSFKIPLNQELPLHSLMGMVIKEFDARNIIESDMTKRILKSTISWLEVFNKVRNDQSLAHPNKLLNYREAQLIYSSVCSVIKFLDAHDITLNENAEDKPLEDFPF